MPPKKRANKPGRRGHGKRRPELPQVPPPPPPLWRRFFYQILIALFVFSLGVIVGMRQGWVEGHHSQRGENQIFQVRELGDGTIVKHGIFREFYPKGRNLKEQGDYFMGKKHGDWIERYESGKIKSKSVYDDGVLKPGRVEWDENGREIAGKAPF